jgi:DNA-binding FadR family transcriptional regulator
MTERPPTTESERSVAARSEKTPDRIARRVLREIRDRKMAAGERLPNEVTMAQEFGVGRASIREALRILETHGLVQIKAGPRGGPVVRQANGVDFGRTMSMFFSHRGATYREVIEARLAFEPMQARLAAERLTDDGLVLLHHVAEIGWQSLDASDEVWVDSSRGVHRTISALSGNRVLELALGGLLAVEASYVAHAVQRKYRPYTLHAHDKIINAIIQRDGDRAEELSRAHMQALVRDIERAYAAEMDHVIEWLNLD